MKKNPSRIIAPQPESKTYIAHPEDATAITRRALLKGIPYCTAYASAAALFGSKAARAAVTYPPQRRLIWISLNGGWDILEATDPKRASTSGIDMSYDFGLANALNGSSSSERIGRWLPNIASRGESVVVLRGLTMGTTSHQAGQIYMDTGVLSNAGRVNAASIPSIVASESNATIPIIQLNGGMEPMTDRGLLNPVSVVRAQNLDLYQSMYPATSDELDQKLRILDHLKQSVDRVQATVGTNDRLTDVKNAEDKIRGQFTSDVGSKLSLTPADLAPFTNNPNAPQGRMNSGERDAFALALKMIKNDLVTCVNLGVGGFDTHANQSTRLQPILQSFDFLMGVLIDELSSAGLLDTTLIVVYSDFGRTPKVNGSNGRDHWPVGGALMIGGGIEGGRFVGGTNDNLQAEYTNITTGEVSNASNGTVLNPTNLGGSVLELTLGSAYLTYRSYLTSIPALVRLKGASLK